MIDSHDQFGLVVVQSGSLTESPSSRLANARTAGDWMATEVSEFASGLGTVLGVRIYCSWNRSHRIYSQSLTRPLRPLTCVIAFGRCRVVMSRLPARKASKWSKL